MALSVTTNFIGTPLASAPPFTVSFTDLSEVTDGFIRLWFWEFGDGAVSTDQNPTHEYDGVGGETFDVKLSVLITSGEFDAFVTAFNNAISAGAGSVARNGLSFTDEPEAWENFLLDAGTPGSSFSAVHQLARSGGTDRQYKNIIADISVESAQVDAPGLLHTLTCNPSPFTVFQGLANAGPNSVPYINGDARQFHHVIENVVQFVPVLFSTSVTPVGRLPDTVNINTQNGLNVSWTLLSYLANGSQTSSKELKEQYITIGTPPVAAFNANPKQGPNPLPVQFENLSIPAVGADTIYTWKKRISGSGDPFVLFSTDENPLELFIK